MNRLLAGLAIVLLTFAATAALYPSLPNPMASHWNAAGEADGTMPKPIGAFFAPLIALFALGVIPLAAKLDPLRANIEQFRGAFEWFIVSFTFFFAYVQALIVATNLGLLGSVMPYMGVGVGFLLIVIGQVLAKTKRNWIMGIRTPWTLSSDVSWEKTHKLGRIVFTILGIVAIGAFFFGPAGLYLFLGCVVIGVLFLIGYSYSVYKSKQ